MPKICNTNCHNDKDIQEPEHRREQNLLLEINERIAALDQEHADNGHHREATVRQLCIKLFLFLLRERQTDLGMTGHRATSDEVPGTLKQSAADIGSRNLVNAVQTLITQHSHYQTKQAVLRIGTSEHLRPTKHART